KPVEWDFGDGTKRTGTRKERHFYQQDGHYVVTATVAKKHGMRVAERTIDVRNVAPSFALAETADWVPGRPFVLRAAISDPGRDTFTATIDWGDGTTEDVDVARNELGGSHVYEADGDYRIHAS